MPLPEPRENAPKRTPRFGRPAEPADGPLHVLVVCTGNICRSPIAEQLLRARAAEEGLPLTVASAGTYAMVRMTMPGEAQEQSRRYGGDLSAQHRPAQLIEGLIARADLVLTAEREHRKEVVQLYPRASRYSFTLRQMARLVRDIEADGGYEAPGLAGAGQRMRRFIDDVAAMRGFAPAPDDPREDDVIDPYRQSTEVYETAGRLIDEATRDIVRGLAMAARAA